MVYRRLPQAIGGALLASAALLSINALATPSTAHADDRAYVVNVTLRGGYNFPNADAALAYGHGVCDKFIAAESYSQLISDIERDFSYSNAMSDYYQSKYLIDQSVEQLCADQIVPLHHAEGHYSLTPS